MQTQQTTTIGREFLESRLPERWKGRYGTLDGDGVESFLNQVAHEDPDSYPSIVKAITDVGGEAATYYGNEASYSLKDFDNSPDIEEYRKRIQHRMGDVIRGGGKPEDLIPILSDALKEGRQVVGSVAQGRGGGLAAQVRSGARGNIGSLTQILLGDVLLDDAEGNPVPIPALEGYIEGVTPLTYWASTHGARKGQVDVQAATARAGYLGKQLTNVAHRVMVNEEDCGTRSGIPVDPNDADIEGSMLSLDVGDIPAGTVIDRGVLKGVKKPVYVRSSVTCQAKHGICSKCAGKRESGNFPDIGEPVGLVASRAVSEPVTQSGLCLAKGTLVRMADWSTKAIEDIKVGDVVLGADTKGKTFPVKVLNTFYNGKREVYEVSYRKGSTKDLVTIKCTLDHKILQTTFKSNCKEEAFNGIPRVLPAKEPGRRVSSVLHNGLSCTYGDVSEPSDPIRAYDLLLCQRKNIEKVGDIDTYDIEVDHEDHLFVLANGMIVSNSVKHTGGISEGARRKIQGFEELNQFFQVPPEYIGATPVVDRDGTVTAIRKGKVGGHTISVEGNEYFVPEDQKVVVKVGDKLEAGDALGDAIPSPDDIVRHKGIGEGRRYFVEKFLDALSANKARVNRRNVEAVARGFVNRVKITDPEGIDGAMIGDVVPYDDIVRDYEPREGANKLKLSEAVGGYLEEPILHYAIGDRVTKKAVEALREYGVQDVLVHKDPPGFEAILVKSPNILSTDPDWMTRLSGEGLKKSLLDSARRGGTSTPYGTSYVPSAADPSKMRPAGSPIADIFNRLKKGR